MSRNFRPGHDASERFYVNTASDFTPKLENKRIIEGMPVFLFAAWPGSRQCLLGTFSPESLKRT